MSDPNEAHCCIAGCETNGPSDTVELHPLPVNSSLRKAWQRKIPLNWTLLEQQNSLTSPKSSSENLLEVFKFKKKKKESVTSGATQPIKFFVCSIHFTYKDYVISKSKTRRLRSSAVPSLHLDMSSKINEVASKDKSEDDVDESNTDTARKKSADAVLLIENSSSEAFINKNHHVTHYSLPRYSVKSKRYIRDIKPKEPVDYDSDSDSITPKPDSSTKDPFAGYSTSKLMPDDTASSIIRHCDQTNTTYFLPGSETSGHVSHYGSLRMDVKRTAHRPSSPDNSRATVSPVAHRRNATVGSGKSRTGKPFPYEIISKINPTTAKKVEPTSPGDQSLLLRNEELEKMVTQLKMEKCLLEAQIRKLEKKVSKCVCSLTSDSAHSISQTSEGSSSGDMPDFVDASPVDRCVSYHQCNYPSPKDTGGKMIFNCGLDMPLRTSSLSSDHLDVTPTPMNTASKKLSNQLPSSNHHLSASSGVANNSVAGVLMRHERRGSLNQNTTSGKSQLSGCSGGMSNGNNMRPPRPATVSYELSDDLRQKEIELTERRYGGRIMSHRAARRIQSAYREYKMKVEYDRIRHKRTSRRIDNRSFQDEVNNSKIHNKSIPSTVPENHLESPSHSSNSNTRQGLTRQLSVEDLVLERAYWDWEGQGDQSDRGSSSGSHTPQRVSTGSRHGLENGSTPSGGSHISPTTVGTKVPSSRDSGVDAEDSQSSPSGGPSASNSTSSMNSSNSEGIVVATSCRGIDHQSVCGTLTPASFGSTTSTISGTLTSNGSNSTPTKQSPNHHHSNHSNSCHRAAQIVSPARVTASLTHQDSPNPPTPHSTSSASSSTYSTGTSSRRCIHGNSTTSGCCVSPIVLDHVGHAPSCVKPIGGSSSSTLSCCHNNSDKRRKRTYRIGLNIFNKSPMKGIDILVRNGFIVNSPSEIARFLVSRKGLSRWAIGECLGNVKSDLARNVTRQFIRAIDLRNKEVDIALRHLMSYFRIPGESQKISHILEVFNEVYVEQNPIRAAAQFRKTDTIMVVCYAVMMLHTDMYSPNVRNRQKMTRDEFVNNLREMDDGKDMDRNLLLAIYDRLRAQEMKPLPDHTEQVRKIDQHLTGPLRPNNLVEPHRRLVCYCRVFEVPDVNKRERPSAHQRDVFLFNDLLVVTKTAQKRRKEGATSVYQCRKVFNLLKAEVFLFESQYYPHGIQVKRDGQVLVTLNTRSNLDRDRFVEDLQECVMEVAEMDRLRMEEERIKAHRGTSPTASTTSNPLSPNNTSSLTADHSYMNSVSASALHKSHCTSSSSLPSTHPLSRSSSRTSTSSQPGCVVTPPPPIVGTSPHQFLVGQCPTCPQVHRHHPAPYQHHCSYHHHHRSSPGCYIQQSPAGVHYHHHNSVQRDSGDSGLVVDMDTKII